jgi:hypothetical protein
VGIKQNQDASPGLTQMLRIPAYARAIRLCGLACSQSFDASDRAEAELPLNSSWGLYEQWCFERMRVALETIVGTAAHPAPNMFGVGADAYVWHMPNQKVILAAQVTFSSGSGPHEHVERYSLSRERRPDAVLIVSHRDETKWYVFDAKYRQSKGNVLDAMSSAHIYRDSLLMNGKRCERAILLAPGTAFNDDWQIFRPSHWRQFGTGVMQEVCPDGNGLTMLTDFLADAISPADGASRVNGDNEA